MIKTPLFYIITFFITKKIKILILNLSIASKLGFTPLTCSELFSIKDCKLFKPIKILHNLEDF